MHACKCPASAARCAGNGVLYRASVPLTTSHGASRGLMSRARCADRPSVRMLGRPHTFHSRMFRVYMPLAREGSSERAMYRFKQFHVELLYLSSRADKGLLLDSCKLCIHPPKHYHGKPSSSAAVIVSPVPMQACAIIIWCCVSLGQLPHQHRAHLPACGSGACRPRSGQTCQTHFAAATSPSFPPPCCSHARPAPLNAAIQHHRCIRGPQPHAAFALPRRPPCRSVR